MKNVKRKRKLRLSSYGKRIIKKALVICILTLITIISIIQLITIEKQGTTPNGGQYTCKGGIVKICNGDSKAYDYFE